MTINESSTERWVPTYLSEFTGWLGQHSDFFAWWQEIKISAAIRPGMGYVGKTRMRTMLDYGEWPVTMSWLSNHWESDETAIAAFLETLIDDGKILMEKRGLITVIKVCNFEKYFFPLKKNRMERQAQLDASGTQENASLEYNRTIPSPENTVEIPTQISTEPTIAVTDSTVNSTAESTKESPARLTVTPIIKKKKKTESKSKKETISSLDPVEREKKFFEDLKIAQPTLEQMAKSMRVDVPLLLTMLEDFYNYCISTDEFHESYSRFKGHFLNWARKQHRENISKQTTTSNYVKNIETNSGAGSKAVGRRGSDGSGATAADYSKPLPD